MKTNREKILTILGDSLVADRYIDRVPAYRTMEELKSNTPHVEYKFGGAIYKNYEDAFNAMKKWLDEEATI